MMSEGKRIDGVFDILKGIALLGMPFVNLWEDFETLGMVPETLSSLSGATGFFTVFGPGIFLICFGPGLINNRSYAHMRKTGVMFILLNTLLNVIRYIISGLCLAIAGEMSLSYVLAHVFCSDIYSFVGLFLIACSFLKERGLTTGQLFGTGIAGTVLGILISTFVSMEVSPVGMLLAHFIPVTDWAYFPLVIWFVYPCIGMLFKEKVFPMEKRKRTGVLAVTAGLCLLVFLLVLLSLDRKQMTLADAMYLQIYESSYRWEITCLLLSCAVGLVAVLALIYPLIPENPLEKFLTKLSKLILPYYVFHVLISFGLIVYPTLVYMILKGELLDVTVPVYCTGTAVVVALSYLFSLKWGYDLFKWMNRALDFSRWFRKRK